jgi:beta-lactamase regulating signal transducer with metallopeptidase domain
VDTLLHAALANALTATLLAVPVAAVARLGRRPALAHALWLLVLLKLVTPPLFPVRLPWADPLADAPREQPPLALAPGAAEPAGGALVPEPTGAMPLIPEAAAPVLAADPIPLPQHGWDRWMGLLAVVWLTGSGLWWGLVCLRVGRFRRLLRHARSASSELQAQVRHLAARLGLKHCPGVWLVPARVSPLLWALGWAPSLLLPADLWVSLTPAQRSALLAHELAHLRRRDHWVRRLELLVLGLFWWHPVAWWARHELAEAEEACCDAWVVWALPEAGPSYAEALVATAAFLSGAPCPVPVAASGAGRVKTLKRRLLMILQRPCPRTLSGAGLIVVLGLAVLLLPLIPTWAGPQAGERDEVSVAPPAARPVPERPARAAAPVRGKEVPADPAGEAGSRPAQETPSAQPAGAAALDELRAEVEVREAQLAAKRAQLDAAQAALRYAEQVLARLLTLHKRQAVTQEEVDQAQAQREARKADVEVSRANLRETEVRLVQARRRLAAAPGRPGAVENPAAGEAWAAQLFDARIVEVKVRPTEKATWRVRLTNRTKEPVRISGVRTSAGALTATLSAETLAPGATGFLDVTVDGRRFVGAKVFTVYVQFDRPAAAEVRLQVRAVAGDAQNPNPAAASEDDRARLRRLEEQLELLRKEVESLRKKLPARPPAGAGPEAPRPREVAPARSRLAPTSARWLRSSPWRRTAPRLGADSSVLAQLRGPASA